MNGKKVLASSNDSLACALVDLGAFWSVVAHLPGKKSILPYLSSLSMVAVLVCDSHRQAGSSTFRKIHQMILLLQLLLQVSDLPLRISSYALLLRLTGGAVGGGGDGQVTGGGVLGGGRQGGDVGDADHQHQES